MTLVRHFLRRWTGARRTLTSADGSTIVERLEALDGAAHRLSYALLTDTPFRNCLTTMLVHDLGQGQAEVEWSATFEADGLPADEAREMLESALAANCLALKQFMEAGRKSLATGCQGSLDEPPA